MFRLLNVPQLLHNADNGGTSTSGGASGDQQQQQSQQQQQGASSSTSSSTTSTSGTAAVETSFQRALERTQGDAVQLARLLFGENYDYRNTIRDLTARVPAEGAVVLSGNDAAHWATYRELGTPDELRSVRTERDTFAQREQQRERAALLDEAATVSGFDPDVLKELAGAQLVVEVKKEQKEGKEVKIAYVVKDDKTLEPLAAHAERAWSKFMPALKVQQQQQRTSSGLGTPRSHQQPTNAGDKQPANGGDAGARPKIRL